METGGRKKRERGVVFLSKMCVPAEWKDQYVNNSFAKGKAMELECYIS